MIMIVKDGMCKDCTRAELELSDLSIGADRVWKIRCRHEPAYARIQAMMDPKETK